MEFPLAHELPYSVTAQSLYERRGGSLTVSMAFASVGFRFGPFATLAGRRTDGLSKSRIMPQV